MWPAVLVALAFLAAARPTGSTAAEPPPGFLATPAPAVAPPTFIDPPVVIPVLPPAEPELPTAAPPVVTLAAPPAAVRACSFVTPPAIPFYWEPACTAGVAGCRADAAHDECRFCGEPPFEAVPCPAPELRATAETTALPATVGWIVVGGGAAGCGAAAALADAGEDVLVLERGVSDREAPATKQMGTWPFVVNTDVVQALRFTDGTWGAVAKVLGGGTSINGGYVFEEAPDWLQSALGEDLDLEAYYASSRQIAASLASPVQPSEYGRAWARALAEAGHGADPTPQLRWKEGAWVPMATFNTSARGWPRRGGAALLHDRSALPNLRVITRALVHRVVFNGTRATGVRVSLDPAAHMPRQPTTIVATKGVLLAAGALLTPQLLQLSGVGRATLMAQLGLKPVVPELPVGRNLVDRLVLSLGVKASPTLPLSIGYAVALNKSLGLTFETEAGGQITSEFAIASLALNAPADRTESLRSFFKGLFRYPWDNSPTPLAGTVNDMMQILAIHHQTYSRGWVSATSLDPSVPPAVTANYYGDVRDLDLQATAMAELIKISSTQALAQYVSEKVRVEVPDDILADGLACAFLGPSYQGRGSQDLPFSVLPCLPRLPATEQEWIQWYRKQAISSYHYFGTAAVGSVVDSGDFRVKGAQGLHVVDASVIPFPPRVNPQHTVMTIGHYVGKRLAGKTLRI